jgi:hypothetical protein
VCNCCAAISPIDDAMMWAACVAEHLLGSMATTAPLFSGGTLTGALGYPLLFLLVTMVPLAGCTALKRRRMIETVWLQSALSSRSGADRRCPLFNAVFSRRPREAQTVGWKS